MMKVVNLKQAILQAWKERWSDYQWAINMKKFFPKGTTWDILNLAEALLEQAMIGPSPNPLLLSYLKYAISSQMVSYSTVLMAISKFDDFSRDLCVQSLLEIMDMFCDHLSCHGKAEECIGLCRALMSVLIWMLRCAAFYTEKLKELLEQGAAENQLNMCLDRLIPQVLVKLKKYSPGEKVILSEASPPGEVPFFETWMQTCMPEEGKILNPDHPCFRPDSTKVETLVALLNNSSEMKLV
ncbi:putative Mediator complex subunit 24 isoform 1 protein [Naja naja]|nr:putative Mediator complex subunit 24 isoform 1 protein [Naja naja]